MICAEKSVAASSYESSSAIVPPSSVKRDLKYWPSRVVYSTPLSHRKPALCPNLSNAYSAPTAAWTLSPKQARNIMSPTWEGILGDVAPTVMNGIFALWNVGPDASTESVSV